MEVTEFLKNAKALINTPEKWTQKAYARDAGGNDIDDASTGAVCFCSLGALWRTKRDLSLSVAMVGRGTDALRDALEELEGGCLYVAMFNDSHKHADVMKMFDLAIAKAGGAK